MQLARIALLFVLFTYVRVKKREQEKQLSWQRMQRKSEEVEWCNSEERWWYNGRDANPWRPKI